MQDGFLGYRSSFMLDFVVVALVAVVPLVLFSLFVVKVQRNYLLHKRLQILIAAVLLIAVTAFEVDVQWLQGGWEKIVAKRETPLTAEGMEQVRKILYIHLAFAVSTPLLWAVTLFAALRRFPSPPVPSSHSRLHKTLGWAATLDLVLTSATGLLFYYAAFIAK